MTAQYFHMSAYCWVIEMTIQLTSVALETSPLVVYWDELVLFALTS